MQFVTLKKVEDAFSEAPP